MAHDVTPLYCYGDKPRYRIQWDYCNGEVIGYWVWTCNTEAVFLKTSFYIAL
jgi:hypothetical protein